MIERKLGGLMSDCDYRHILDENLGQYIIKVSEILHNNIIIKEGEGINIKRDEKTGNIAMVTVKVLQGIIVDIENYSVKFKEKTVANNRKIELKNFSYQLMNKKDSADFIRFDLDFKEKEKGFSPLHANADPKKWGSEHLIFQENIDLNLKKLELSKAYYIFLHYVHHPEEHPYDKNKNYWYKKQLD